MRLEQIHGILVDGDLSGGTGPHLASATGVTHSPFQAAPMRLEQKRNKEQLLEEYDSTQKRGVLFCPLFCIIIIIILTIIIITIDLTIAGISALARAGTVVRVAWLAMWTRCGGRTS